MRCIDFDWEMMILKKRKTGIGNRLLHLLLCVCMIFGCAVPGAFSVSAESGTCGDSTTWNLSDGVLTIGGTGAVQVVAWAGWKTQITSVVIGDGVTSIPARVFSGLTKLQSVKFGKSLKEIPSGVCSKCSALTTVTFSEGLRTISSGAFQNCYVLKTVSFPSTLQTIGDKAFFACLKITSIALPDSVTSVGDEAFKANNAAKLTLGSKLETIGKEAFAVSCFSEVTVPDSVQSIGAGAFGTVYGSVSHSGDTINHIFYGKEQKVTLIGKANGVAQQFAKAEGLNFRVYGEQAHTHTWSEWKTKTAAGCETEGEQIRTCTGCNETESKKIPATGHSFGEWKTETAPGCETEGKNVRVCAGCGKKEYQTVPAVGHAMGDWMVETEPGCETEGRNVRVCAGCGKKEYQTVPATGHSWSEWETVKEPTIDDAGQQQSKCSKCGEIRTSEITKLISYTVSVSVSEGGSVTPSGETRVAEGSSLTLKAAADDGYVLLSVFVNGSELQPDTAGSILLRDIRANQSVSVVFQKKAQPKTRRCNFVDVTPQRTVWLTDESGISVQDFKIYANITDKGAVSWLEITADCLTESTEMPASEPYGTGSVCFRYQGSDEDVMAYLEQNSITAQIPLYLRGDGDLSGVTDVTDAQLALRAYVLQLTGARSDGLSDVQRAVMDVDGNGETSLEDAAYILHYYTKQMAGLIPDWKAITNRT